MAGRRRGSAPSRRGAALAAAAVPALALLLAVPGDPVPRLSSTLAGARPTLPAPRASAERPGEARDLRGFVERNLERAADQPVLAYYVAQALEECAVVRPFPADRQRRVRWREMAAAETLADACRGFEDSVIESEVILELLRRAAGAGEPHAIARMLLLRDVAAPKDDIIPELPSLLATGDPAVIRDVGAFLSRGVAAWRYGSEEVPAGVAAIAWELAACDLGYACGPSSRLVLAQCAFRGNCEPGRYEDTLAVREPPDVMAQASRLRHGIVRALLSGDWAWLGLA